MGLSSATSSDILSSDLFLHLLYHFLVNTQSWVCWVLGVAAVVKGSSFVWGLPSVLQTSREIWWPLWAPPGPCSFPHFSLEHCPAPPGPLTNNSSVVQPSSGRDWTGQPHGVRVAAVLLDHTGTPWSDLMGEAEPLSCQPWVLSGPAEVFCENGGHLVAAPLLSTTSLSQMWLPCMACGSCVWALRLPHHRGCNVVCGALVLSSSQSWCWTNVGILGDAETTPSLPSFQDPFRQPCSSNIGRCSC